MSGPIILTLASWAQQRLTTLLQATSKPAFDAAFDALVAPHAQITLNGAKTSRAAYAAYLWKAQAHERSAAVDFKGVVAVPKSTDVLIQVRDPPTGGGAHMLMVVTDWRGRRVLRVQHQPAAAALLGNRHRVAQLDVSRFNAECGVGADGYRSVDQPTDQPEGVDKRSVVVLTQVSTERPSNVEPLPGQ